MRALAALLVLALAACTTNAAQQGNLAMAKSRLRDGDYPGALSAAETVITLGSANRSTQLDGFFLKAQVLERLGRKNEAAGLYEYVIFAAPDSENAFLAKARLGEIGAVCSAGRKP